MSADSHLALRLMHLNFPDNWMISGDALHLVFPQGGSGEYTASGLRLRLSPGDALVASGSAEGVLSTTPPGEFVYTCFSLRIEHMYPLLYNDEIRHMQMAVSAFGKPIFYPSSSTLAKECHRLLAGISSPLSLDHRIQLLRVFGNILTVELKSLSKERNGYVRAHEHMLQVFERLSSKDLMELSIEELADKFSCSRRHLNRLFHQHFGFSVTSLRMELRLLRAASLLRDPDVKISNVAIQSGFNHLGLFNTCFKRRFKVSPTEWRKNIDSNPDAGVIGFEDTTTPDASPYNGSLPRASAHKAEKRPGKGIFDNTPPASIPSLEDGKYSLLNIFSQAGLYSSDFSKDRLIG